MFPATAMNLRGMAVELFQPLRACGACRLPSFTQAELPVLQAASVAARSAAQVSALGSAAFASLATAAAGAGPASGAAAAASAGLAVAGFTPALRWQASSLVNASRHWAAPSRHCS